MPNMEVSFQACFSFLQKKFIKVQKEWLEACLEWIIAENGGGQTTTELCNLVYEQWLMADISEIADAAFPTNLKTLKGNISGHFCVQVNSYMDIGRSAYSQLQKLKGIEMDYDDTEDENEAKEFFKKSSDEAKAGGKHNNKKWNEKTSRMLWFELHDGFQKVEAIEYTPINHLKIDDLEPGCKVHLFGSIMCRENILLLKSENIKVLGGNVEGLMESKTQTKILSDKLSIVEDTKPPSLKINKTINQRSTTNMQKSSFNNALPTATNKSKNNKSESEMQQPKSESEMQQPKRNNRLTSSHTRQSVSIKQQTRQEVKAELNDDFLDAFDNDDDLFFQDLNVDGIDEPKIKDNITTSRKKHASLPHDEDIEMADDIDEDLFDDNDDIFETLPSKINDSIRHTEKQAVKFLSVVEMTSQERPLTGHFQVKAYFKTLVSRLNFDDKYRLFAILADHGEDFLKVMVGNSALVPVIGYEATKVREAISNQVPKEEKQKIRQALKGAEKSLELNKWCMTISFNQEENIYEVMKMMPLEEG